MYEYIYIEPVGRTHYVIAAVIDKLGMMSNYIVGILYNHAMNSQVM